MQSFLLFCRYILYSTIGVIRSSNQGCRLSNPTSGIRARFEGSLVTRFDREKGFGLEQQEGAAGGSIDR